jgi:hypothetical protein
MTRLVTANRRSKTNGEPRNRQVDTGNLERPAPELTDAYNAANEAISVTYGTREAEAFGDPLAEPDGPSLAAQA